ncbi:hypothetical protein IAQ61_001631 [Plenodomus lingam]|uniref:uncharacterized protein n=1 Tax=Leptosphaeria maculans TaxID=5022 RepID=UPI00332CBF0B|nr:hypothetical protein IAQ61_001631 [Plenodomus lingam]
MAGDDASHIQITSAQASVCPELDGYKAAWKSEAPELAQTPRGFATNSIGIQESERLEGMRCLWQ